MTNHTIFGMIKQDFAKENIICQILTGSSDSRLQLEIKM